MNQTGYESWVMKTLRHEAFRPYKPRGRGPETFAAKVKGYLARRAIHIIKRLSPAYAVREIGKLNPEQRDPSSLVNFVFTRLMGLIKPSQVPSEILSFAKLIKELQPKTVLEVGTANGGTLFLLCRLAHPDATVISVDLPGGVYGGGYPEWKTPVYQSFQLPQQSLHLLRADSHAQETLEKVKSLLGGRRLDLLLIDADHTYEGVKKDYELYSPLTEPGGVVAFHDIVPHPPELGCGVDRFWNEIKRPQSREIIEDVAQEWAGIGIL